MIAGDGDTKERQRSACVNNGGVGGLLNLLLHVRISQAVYGGDL